MCLSRLNLVSCSIGPIFSEALKRYFIFVCALEISESRNKGLFPLWFYFERMFLCEKSVFLSGCLAFSCSTLPEQTLLSDDQMLWGPGLPYHCHFAFLIWLASLSPSILITMKSSRCSLGVFYLWDLLAYGKSLTSFL